MIEAAPQSRMLNSYPSHALVRVMLRTLWGTPRRASSKRATPSHGAHRSLRSALPLVGAALKSRLRMGRAAASRQRASRLGESGGTVETASKQNHRMDRCIDGNRFKLNRERTLGNDQWHTSQGTGAVAGGAADTNGRMALLFFGAAIGTANSETRNEAQTEKHQKSRVDQPEQR